MPARSGERDVGGELDTWIGLQDRGHLEAADVSVAHAYEGWGLSPGRNPAWDHGSIVPEASMDDKIFVGVDVSDWLGIAGMAAGSCGSPTREKAVATWVGAGGDALVAFEPTGALRILREIATRAVVARFTPRVPPPGAAARPRPTGSMRGCWRPSPRSNSPDAGSPLTDDDETLREMIAAVANSSTPCRPSAAVRAIEPRLSCKEAPKNAIAVEALDDVETAIAAHIKAHDVRDDRRHAAGLEASAPSPCTSAGRTAETGRLTGKQIAALVGPAPRTRQSGKSALRATTGHGRPGVRRVLFRRPRRHPLEPGNEGLLCKAGRNQQATGQRSSPWMRNARHPNAHRWPATSTWKRASGR